jgi:hypothetical protein
MIFIWCLLFPIYDKLNVKNLKFSLSFDVNGFSIRSHKNLTMLMFYHVCKFLMF